MLYNEKNWCKCKEVRTRMKNKLSSLAMNKRSIMIFIILIFTNSIITLSAQATFNVEGFRITELPSEKLGSKTMQYFDILQNAITDKPKNANGQPNQQMIDGSLIKNDPTFNSQQKWNNIPDNLRVDFLKDSSNSNLLNKLSPEQKTLTYKMQDVIRDPAYQHVWNEITKNGEGKQVYENMGYIGKGDFRGWNWDLKNGKRILRYGEAGPGPEVYVDYTKGYEAKFSQNGIATLKNIGTDYITGVDGPMSWSPPYDLSLGFLQEPRAAPTASPSGLSSAGGGGGGGGGDGFQQFQKVLEAVNQIIGLVQPALQKLQQQGSQQPSSGSLADSVVTNDQGDKSISSPNQYGGITTELSRGAEVGFMRGGKETLVASQNKKDEKAKQELDGDEPIAHLENTDFIVPQQLAGKTPIKSTTVEAKGIDSNDPSNPSLTDREVYASPQLSPITAQVVAQGEIFDYGQYIKLKNHDLDISGEDITVYALKTFNEVIVGGQNLKVFDGEIEMKFEGQRIYYPRLVKNAPYGVKQISNKLDQNNKFRLQHYTNKKGSLIDNREIISISDITTNHPRNELIISKIRLPMWETG